MQHLWPMERTSSEAPMKPVTLTMGGSATERVEPGKAKRCKLEVPPSGKPGG
jgi:hypothetical protein